MKKALFVLACLTTSAAVCAPARSQTQQGVTAANTEKMTNADVIALAGLGLSDDIIIAKIRAAKVTEFDTTVGGLTALKAAKVSDGVIRVMLDPQKPQVDSNAAESPSPAPSSNSASVATSSKPHAKDAHPPLPASVIAAKTVFIDNQTGDAEITDRAYGALSKWGRFQILKNAKDADLVLRFTADAEGRPTPPHNDIDKSPTPVLFSVRDQANNELWFASKNKPFHSQTQLDIDEFKKRIEEQEKGK